jgi:hypothetical protein
MQLSDKSANTIDARVLEVQKTEIAQQKKVEHISHSASAMRKCSLQRSAVETKASDDSSWRGAQPTALMRGTRTLANLRLDRN